VTQVVSRSAFAERFNTLGWTVNMAELFEALSNSNVLGSAALAYLDALIAAGEGSMDDQDISGCPADHGQQDYGLPPQPREGLDVTDDSLGSRVAFSGGLGGSTPPRREENNHPAFSPSHPTTRFPCKVRTKPFSRRLIDSSIGNHGSRGADCRGREIPLLAALLWLPPRPAAVSSRGKGRR
jgi:hypothetical protein